MILLPLKPDTCNTEPEQIQDFNWKYLNIQQFAYCWITSRKLEVIQLSGFVEMSIGFYCENIQRLSFCP